MMLWILRYHRALSVAGEFLDYFFSIEEKERGRLSAKYISILSFQLSSTSFLKIRRNFIRNLKHLYNLSNLVIINVPIILQGVLFSCSLICSHFNAVM